MKNKNNKLTYKAIGEICYKIALMESGQQFIVSDLVSYNYNFYGREFYKLVNSGVINVSFVKKQNNTSVWEKN